MRYSQETPAFLKTLEGWIIACIQVSPSFFVINHTPHFYINYPQMNNFFILCYFQVPITICSRKKCANAAHRNAFVLHSFCACVTSALQFNIVSMRMLPGLQLQTLRSLYQYLTQGSSDPVCFVFYNKHLCLFVGRLFSKAYLIHVQLK